MDINSLMDSWFAPILIIIFVASLYYMFYVPILLFKKPIQWAVANPNKFVKITIISSLFFTSIWLITGKFAFIAGVINFILLFIGIYFLIEGYKKIRFLNP